MTEVQKGDIDRRYFLAGGAATVAALAFEAINDPLGLFEDDPSKTTTTTTTATSTTTSRTASTSTTVPDRGELPARLQGFAGASELQISAGTLFIGYPDQASVDADMDLMAERSTGVRLDLDGWEIRDNFPRTEDIYRRPIAAAERLGMNVTGLVTNMPWDQAPGFAAKMVRLFGVRAEGGAIDRIQLDNEVNKDGDPVAYADQMLIPTMEQVLAVDPNMHFLTSGMAIPGVSRTRGSEFMRAVLSRVPAELKPRLVPAVHLYGPKDQPLEQWPATLDVSAILDVAEQNGMPRLVAVTEAGAANGGPEKTSPIARLAILHALLENRLGAEPGLVTWYTHISYGTEPDTDSFSEPYFGMFNTDRTPTEIADELARIIPAHRIPS